MGSGLTMINTDREARPSVTGYKTTKEAELYASIYKKNFKRAKQLVLSGAPVDCINLDGATPLIEVCRTTLDCEKNNDCEEFVRILLKRGCNTAKMDIYGWTAYMYAIQQRHLHIAKLIEARHQHKSLHSFSNKRTTKVSSRK